MSGLTFVSPGAARDEAGFAPRAASPLARALADAEGIVDLSMLGKLEVRGTTVPDLGPAVETIPITPARALVICPPERCAELADSLPGFVVDLSGALAGIAVESPVLMRRLTDLDLETLPAAGKVAGVTAVVSSGEGSFRMFFPQEYGHSVVETVCDLIEGLA